ncbi:hypothetical protein [Kribbella ginsengisoli]|uniref:DUF418 domain-containing protein n=1 Tax=Kribbella ginsengisoli TaxID=363865 RepID=A0ABP6WNQ0_9ACTN
MTLPGPTAVSARALGPDLARGLLLLFIALANTHGFLHPPGVSDIRGTPIASALPDRIAAFLETTLVDGRSYTMFAALFGYGMVQIMRRQEASGADWPGTRKLLRRRGRWMVVLGVRRHGMRGPFEVLLRRLTYRRLTVRTAEST